MGPTSTIPSKLANESSLFECDFFLKNAAGIKVFLCTVANTSTCSRGSRAQIFLGAGLVDASIVCDIKPFPFEKHFIFPHIIC